MHQLLYPVQKTNQSVIKAQLSRPALLPASIPEGLALKCPFMVDSEGDIYACCHLRGVSKGAEPSFHRYQHSGLLTALWLGVWRRAANLMRYWVVILKTQIAKCPCSWHPRPWWLQSIVSSSMLGQSRGRNPHPNTSNLSTLQ
jgi:hypothetical protein